MIDNGSTVILQTEEAIYSPCKIISMSTENITITYFAGMKKEGKTGKYYESRPVETISRKKIVSISERL